MKMSEILRQLADKLDKIENGSGEDSETQNRLKPVEVSEPEQGDSPKFVPPLQAKLEILKKSEGIPNVYDEQGQGNDELAAIKKNAGLTTAQHEASEDNDVLG